MKAGPHPSCLVAVKQQFFGGQSPLARIPGEISKILFDFFIITELKLYLMHSGLKLLNIYIYYAT